MNNELNIFYFYDKNKNYNNKQDFHELNKLDINRILTSFPMSDVVINPCVITHTENKKELKEVNVK